MQSAMISNNSPNKLCGVFSVENSIEGPLPFDQKDKDYKGLRGSKQKQSSI